MDERDDLGAGARLPEEEFEQLLHVLRSRQLATDKVREATRVLASRRVTCLQAAAVLREIKLGILQCNFALRVLKGRIVDFPAGLEDLAADQQGAELRRVLELSCSGGAGASGSNVRRREAASCSPNFREHSSPSSPQSSPPAALSGPRIAGAACIERLRAQVQEGLVPPEVAEALGEAFELFGLPPLQPRPRPAAAARQPTWPARNSFDEGPFAPELPAGFQPPERPEELGGLAEGDAEAALEERRRKHRKGRVRKSKSGADLEDGASPSPKGKTRTTIRTPGGGLE